MLANYAGCFDNLQQLHIATHSRHEDATLGYFIKHVTSVQVLLVLDALTKNANSIGYQSGDEDEESEEKSSDGILTLLEPDAWPEALLYNWRSLQRFPSYR